MANPTPTPETARHTEPRAFEPASPPPRSPWRIVLAVVVVVAMLAATGVAALRFADRRQGEDLADALIPLAGDESLGAPQIADPGASAIGGDSLPEPRPGVASIEDAVIVDGQGGGRAEGDVSIDVGAGVLVLPDTDLVVSQDDDGEYTQIESGTATLSLLTW